MSRAAEDRNRRMLRARDTIDRSYATPLDVAALARVTHVSAARESPSTYRERTADNRRAARQYVPACVEKTLRRPVGAAAS
jgi:hypothetical protein